MHLDAAHFQKDVFLASEGDRWFGRNRGVQDVASHLCETVAARVASHLSSTDETRVLEIGCGQGQNLAALRALVPIVAHGIDPSQEAITVGSQRFPFLALEKGSADALPYTADSFDVVWFGFCLYLVDRSLLFRVVAEADRVLRDGGLLAILDFDPGQPSRRPYHHYHGLYTYKMDYSRLFLGNPSYLLIEKISSSHTAGKWSPDPQERLALTLCRKSHEQAYIDV